MAAAKRRTCFMGATGVSHGRTDVESKGRLQRSARISLRGVRYTQGGRPFAAALVHPRGSPRMVQMSRARHLRAMFMRHDCGPAVFVGGLTMRRALFVLGVL